MKISKNIYLKDFKYNSENKIIKIFNKLINENNPIINSLSKSYKYSYNKKLLQRLNLMTKVGMATTQTEINYHHQIIGF